MITITLNPAIDVSYHLEQFAIDKGYRVENGRKTAGGKGLNVSRVLNILGENPVCTGLLGGSNGEWIRTQLDKQRLQDQFLPIQGETRTCLAILDDSAGTQTELLEKGPTIEEKEATAFLSYFTEALDQTKYVIASGSLPAGLPVDFYCQLAQLAKERDVRFVLDTSGEALRKGIEGQPFLIKPNDEELCAYAKQSSLTIDEMIAVAKQLCTNGVGNVLLSLGKDGALLINEHQVIKASIPTVEAINPVGSGDSMLAGMTHALQQGKSLEDALAWACACGTANAMEAQTGFVQLNHVHDLLTKIQITTI